MTIQLTRGLSTQISAQDYKIFREFKWLAHKVGRRFYAARRIGWRGPYVYLHREVVGAVPKEDVDHKNGDSLDNRRKNLRRCSRSQNLRGFQRKRLGATSKFRGVSFSNTEKVWRAQIKVAGKNKYLGRFESETDAALAYNKAARLFYKDFAQINKVEGS